MGLKESSSSIFSLILNQVELVSKRWPVFCFVVSVYLCLCIKLATISTQAKINSD